MSDAHDSADTPETGERYFSPVQLLDQYDAVGEKARKRFEADHPDTPSYDLPKEIEGIFPLSTGPRAKFGWNESPTFYRPEKRLPSGALVVKSGQWGADEHTDQYLFQRYIESDRVSVGIIYFEYGNSGEALGGTEQLFDQEHYRKINAALSEIETAIDDPNQTIEWHSYGVSYVW